MPRINRALQQYKKDVAEYFLQAQQSPSLTLSTLGTWFRENINHASKLLSGRPGRKLGSLMEHNVNVEIHSGKAYIYYYVSWLYAGTHGYAPALDSLATLINSIEVNPCGGAPVPDALNAVLVFDCFAWKNILPGVIYKYAHTIWADDKAIPAFKTMDARMLKELLSQVYPEVEIEHLRLAAELGIVGEDPDTFIAWFTQHIQNARKKTIKPPENLLT